MRVLLPCAVITPASALTVSSANVGVRVTSVPPYVASSWASLRTPGSSTVITASAEVAAVARGLEVTPQLASSAVRARAEAVSSM